MQTTNDQTPAAAAEELEHKLVEVELNGIPKRIGRGEYTGRTLKLALGVPIEYELDEVVHGEFKEIANDQKVHVRGGEKFVSHCGQGQSS
jgi:hypothetical protein